MKLLRKIFRKKFDPKIELLEEIERQKSIAYFYRVEKDYQEKLGKALISKKDRKRYDELDAWFRENQGKEGKRDSKEWETKRDEFRRLNELIQLSDQVLGWASERGQKLLVTDGYVRYLEALSRLKDPESELARKQVNIESGQEK